MYLAMSSRPWIVPASARYELVDMIASGLSNTRDSTSPGRMPPRARHRIWSNSQPDACDLERQALDQHVVLVPGDVEVFAVVGQHASSAVRALSASGSLAARRARLGIGRYGWRSRIVCSRSGPVETMSIGAPMKLCTRSR